jgi:hypothetical protein
MLRSEFGALVDRAWRTSPEWFRATPDRPPGPGVAQRLRDRLGALLPADYLWFLHEYGGGAFGCAVVFSADESSAGHLCRNQPVPRRSEFIAVTADALGTLGFAVLAGACPDRMMRLYTGTDRIERARTGASWPIWRSLPCPGRAATAAVISWLRRGARLVASPAGRQA